MTADLAERVAAKKPRLDLDAFEAKALGGEAGDLFVAQLGADRHRLEAPAFVDQPLEAFAITRLDLDDLGEPVDRGVEIGHLGRLDLERVGRVVVRQHDAVAVEDEAAVRRNGHHRDPVVLGLRRQLLVLADLQVDEPGDEQAEREEDEQCRGQDAQAKAREIVLGVAQLRHGAFLGRPGGSERSERGGVI